MGSAARHGLRRPVRAERARRGDERRGEDEPLKPRACSCPRAEPSTASCRVFEWTTRRIFSRLYESCMAVLKMPATLAPCARRRRRRPALCARPAASPACRDAPPPLPGPQPPPAAAPASPPGPPRARRGPGPMRATLRAKHPAAIRISHDAMGTTLVSGGANTSATGRAPGLAARQGAGAAAAASPGTARCMCFAAASSARQERPGSTESARTLEPALRAYGLWARRWPLPTRAKNRRLSPLSAPCADTKVPYATDSRGKR